MGGFHVPARIDRAAVRTHDRTHLTGAGGARERRTPPDQWWPAGDAALRSSMLTLPNGLVVRLVSGGAESGPPVLLLHGWGIHAYLWRRTIPALLAAGRRVFAVDLPGHGLSARPLTPGSYSLSAMTANVTAVMDASGIADAVVIGQSMGGRIAIELARTIPERVTALAVFGSVGLGEVPASVALARYLPVPSAAMSSHLVRRWMVALGKGFAYGTRASVAQADIDAYWAPTQFPDFLAAMRQALIDFDWRVLTRADVAHMTMPVLAFFGTQDRTVRPTLAASLVSGMPRGRLHWVRDAGHVANEEAPDEVNPLLVEFITSAT